MNYTIKDLNGCTKLLSFAFESIDISSEIESSLKEKQKSVALKGFRKGKAPLSMIQQMYQGEVQNNVLYKFISKEFMSAMEKEEMNPIGYPVFKNTKYEEDTKSFEFEASVEIFPEFEIKDYSSYSFSRDYDQISESELEEEQKKLLNTKAQIEAIEDETVTLDNGHHVVMNFQGEKEDGEKPENMKGNEFALEIGSKQFIPGFEEGMIGMKKGETKTIEVTFPEDYQAKELQNAKVKFEVEVLEIKEKKLPEFNDEFVKEFEFESVEDYKTKTNEKLAYAKARKADEKLHQEIIEKLVKDHNFDLPKAMIKNQAESLKKETEQQLMRNGFNADMVETYFEKWAEDFNTRAEFQVRSGLILNKIADKYSIESSDEDLEKKYEEIAATSHMDLKTVKDIYANNENVVTNLKYAIREEKTFNKMKEEFTVVQLDS